MKKKAVLTSDLLKSTKSNNVSTGIAQRSITVDSDKEMVGMNFTVSKSFRKKFKGWCVDNDMTMIEALEEAFKLLQQKNI
jgi:hypothetical protein